MATLKDRLIEALEDVSWSGLTEEALVEVLLVDMKRTKVALFEAQSALIKEGIRAKEIERAAFKEIRRMRTDPLAGDYYFTDVNPDVTYVVLVEGPSIYMRRRVGPADYMMRQLTASEEFARRIRAG
jgi:hypothetical protein